MTGELGESFAECIHLLPPDQCTLCNGRAAHQRRALAAEAATVLYSFRAKIDSTLSCGDYALIGDVIHRLGNGHLVCDDCKPGGAP